VATPAVVLWQAGDERKQLWPVFEECRALAGSAAMLAGRQRVGHHGRAFSKWISVPFTPEQGNREAPFFERG